MSLKVLTPPAFLALVGSVVDDIAKQALSTVSKNEFEFAPAPYRIIVLSQAELEGLSKEQLANLPDQIDSSRVFSAGVGRSSDDSLFVVIVWVAGQQFRKKLNLPPKQFYISLSDECGPSRDADVGISCLLPGQFPENTTPDFLDHLAFTLHLFKDYEREQPFCVDLILALTDSHRGFLRMGDAGLATGQHKLAMLSYACAFQRSDNQKLQNYTLKKMVECSKSTEWAFVFVESELSQVPDAIRPLLLTPWSTELRSTIRDMDIIPTLCLESRERLFVPVNPSTASLDASFVKLPRFFRWLVPFHLAIMSTPR
jgi:atypical dual specificity phosphatase